MPHRSLNYFFYVAFAVTMASTAAYLVLVFAPISGAHFNPVVSAVDAWRAGTPRAALPRILAQLVGAPLGVVLAHAMFALPLMQTSTHARAGAGLWLGEIVATAGLLVQFGVQALINMGSTLHILPTKGMTLPFISYGGSSLLALALGMGFMLALTRKRYGPGEGA